eukprot:COSAG02_NODE_217_length_28595_cov_19.642371_23_plen_175_part_00
MHNYHSLLPGRSLYLVLYLLYSSIGYYDSKCTGIPVVLDLVPGTPTERGVLTTTGRTIARRWWWLAQKVHQTTEEKNNDPPEKKAPLGPKENPPGPPFSQWLPGTPAISMYPQGSSGAERHPKKNSAVCFPCNAEILFCCERIFSDGHFCTVLVSGFETPYKLVLLPAINTYIL